jgi:hypothetical protein
MKLVKLFLLLLITVGLYPQVPDSIFRVHHTPIESSTQKSPAGAIPIMQTSGIMQTGGFMMLNDTIPEQPINNNIPSRCIDTIPIQLPFMMCKQVIISVSPDYDGTLYVGNMVWLNNESAIQLKKWGSAVFNVLNSAEVWYVGSDVSNGNVLTIEYVLE